jgi:hypothetical protein
VIVWEAGLVTSGHSLWVCMTRGIAAACRELSY